MGAQLAPAPTPWKLSPIVRTRPIPRARAESPQVHVDLDEGQLGPRLDVVSRPPTNELSASAENTEALEFVGIGLSTPPWGTTLGVRLLNNRPASPHPPQKLTIVSPTQRITQWVGATGPSSVNLVSLTLAPKPCRSTFFRAGGRVWHLC